MNINDLVKISLYTNDPIKKQGEIGQVIAIIPIDEDESEVSVLFSDGVIGVYFDNCLTIVKEEE